MVPVSNLEPSFLRQQSFEFMRSGTYIFNKCIVAWQAIRQHPMGATYFRWLCLHSMIPRLRFHPRIWFLPNHPNQYWYINLSYVHLDLPAQVLQATNVNKPTKIRLIINTDRVVFIKTSQIIRSIWRSSH